MKSSPIKFRPFVPCAYMPCGNAATIGFHPKDKSGWIEVCVEHYDLKKHEEALKWNHDNGLDTIEKRREYITKNFRKVIHGTQVQK